LVDSWKGHRK